MKSVRVALWAMTVASAAPGIAVANDTLIFAATGGAHGWDASVVDYGNRNGFFKEAGIDIAFAFGDNAGLNLQAVISDSADIAGVALHTFIAARIQGAPVKMVSSAFKGASDFLWFVRSDSPLQSFADLTEETTVGVSSLGGSGYIILRSLLDQYNVHPTVVAAGSNAAALTQVMTGALDIATDGNGLLGVPQYAAGEIRPLAFGHEVDAMREVTVRGFVVSEKTLVERRDVIVRFLQAYQRTVDWMYQDPQAIQWFAEDTDTTVEEAARVREHSYPDGVIHLGEVLGLEYSIKQGLDFNRIDRAPTAEELAEMFDVVWKPGSM